MKPKGKWVTLVTPTQENCGTGVWQFLSPKDETVCAMYLHDGAYHLRWRDRWTGIYDCSNAGEAQRDAEAVMRVYWQEQLDQLPDRPSTCREVVAE